MVALPTSAADVRASLVAALEADLVGQFEFGDEVKGETHHCSITLVPDRVPRSSSGSGNEGPHGR